MTRKQILLKTHIIVMIIQLCLLPALFILPNTNHILISIGQIGMLYVQYDNIKNDGYKFAKGYFSA